MKRTRYLAVAAAALFPVLALALAGSGCKKPDDTTPVTSAAPPPPPPPTAAAVITPEEDAGPADAAPDVAAPALPRPGGGGFGTMAKCCNALSQNAKSAPPEQLPYYMAAASACNGMRNTPAGQQAFSQLRAYLQGAKMPAACQ